MLAAVTGLVNNIDNQSLRTIDWVDDNIFIRGHGSGSHGKLPDSRPDRRARQ